MSSASKGLYLESFFSTKLDLDDPIHLSPEDLFFPVDLRFGFYGENGSNDYFAFVASPEAMRKHHAILKNKKVIIVGESPLENMLESIRLVLSRCSSSDSSLAFRELSEFYEWEYDDYRITDD
jgi:hypothetical protein